MEVTEWSYLPLAAFVNTFVVFAWQRWIAKKKIQGKAAWSFLLLGSFMNAWGIDVVHRLAEAMTVFHMFQVVLGLWLFIAAGAAAKHYAMNSWSNRLFWLNYGGDLLGFMAMGLVIFAMT